MDAQYQNFATYLNQDHHKNVKESFKALAKLLHPQLVDRSAKLLDVGCATGALIAFLSECFPKLECTGVDISEDLLAVAREKVEGHQFFQGDATQLDAAWDQQFDVSLAIGVLGIFDEAEAKKVLAELFRVTRPGGSIYLLAQFNDYDLDVCINHRRFKGSEPSNWEKGWNIYSKNTIRSWFESEPAQVEFVDYSMPFALEPQEDPIRTWTMETEHNKYQLTNGLKLLVDLSFLKITRTG